MVYNCGYPIWHTFPKDENTTRITYDILIGNQIIYSGEVLPFENTSDTIRVDISTVCRAYLDTYYEKIDFADVTNALVPTNGLKSTVNVFAVSSGNNPPADSPDEDPPNVNYTVVYNYNTDYILTSDDIANINNPILFEADPRQYLFIAGFSVANDNTYFGFSKNNSAPTFFDALGDRYQVLGLKLNSEQVNAQEGDVISLLQTEGEAPEDPLRYDYTIVKPCKNRFALYYVNKLGGLDNLLCSGRYVNKWNSSRIDARLYDDRADRRDFQQTRLYQDISHRWELNTGWIDDDKAELIDELVFSPKCWIHDLEKDTITSCLVTDSSYSAKRFELDNSPAQYTINVEESQLYERQ